MLTQDTFIYLFFKWVNIRKDAPVKKAEFPPHLSPLSRTITISVPSFRPGSINRINKMQTQTHTDIHPLENHSAPQMYMTFSSWFGSHGNNEEIEMKIGIVL